MGGPLDGPPSTPAALATGDRGATATATSPITYTDPFQRAIPDTSSPTNILKSPLAVKSAVGSLGRGAAGGSGGGPRRQSLIPRSQVPHIKNYLSLGSANDESGCEFDLLSDASQLATRMAPRKIWVKRPGGSPTMVTVGEDDVVDDVRDLILRKYGNSLGRQFDAPDLTIRIVPRDQRQERQLGPEEPMVRTLDAYYPGGQSIDEALIIDVPLRRTTPKASPRNGPPNSTYYAAADDGRPSESAGDYFGPGALGVPSMHHHMLQQQPSAMAMVQSGHIPQIPSPGGSRSSRHYKDRPERPRLGRQHTSSPTILGVGGAGGPATGVIGGVATTAAAGVGLTGGVVAPGASYGRDFPATHQHLSHHSHSNQNNNQHTPPPINTRPRSRAHSNSSDHSQTGAALGNVGPSTPSGMVSSAVGPQQFVAATVGGGGGGASDKAAGSPASVVLLPAAGGGGGPSAATGPSGVRGEGSPASVVATAGGGGGAPSSHRSGDTPPGRVSSPRPGSRAGLAAAGGGVSNGADGGSSNGNVPGPSSRTRRLRRAATTAGGDGHGHAAAGGATTATTKLQIGVPPINVLIVEDNIINLKLLEAFMKRLKVRWQTAMNGRDAVQRWKQGGFHLVLMDIQLPIMSGLEATREIRRLERANGIGVFSSTPSSSPGGGLDADGPQKDAAGSKLQNIDMFKSPVIIVALTASSLQSDRHEALAAGCNDFLTKVRYCF